MFEIYAYGNVDTLTGVFNAIAAIFKRRALGQHVQALPSVLVGDLLARAFVVLQAIMRP